MAVENGNTMDMKTMHSSQIVVPMENKAVPQEKDSLPNELVLSAKVFLNVKTESTKDRNGEITDSLDNSKSVDNNVIMDKAQKAPEVALGKMSVLRKITFVFSFLPSVMFVISFAAILPCIEKQNEYCMKETWSVLVNNTKLSADLRIVEEFAVVGLEDNERGRITKYSKESGKEIWTSLIDSPPRQIQCISSSCIVADSLNQVYLLNISDGGVTTVGQNGIPVLLPNSVDLNEVILLITISELIIFKTGIRLETFIINGCTEVPTNVVYSFQEDFTTLSFLCNSKRESSYKGLFMLFQIRNVSLRKTGKLIELRKQSYISDINKSKIFTTTDGINLWSGNSVVSFHYNGSEKWSTTLKPNALNRMALYGNFNKDQQLLTLLSDSLDTGDLEITLLNSVDGKVIFEWLNTTIRMQKAVTISGGDQDYILLLQEKIGNCTLQSSTIIAEYSEIKNATDNVSERCLQFLLIKFGEKNAVSRVLNAFADTYETEVLDIQLKAMLKEDGKSKKLEVLMGRSLIHCPDVKHYTEIKMFSSKDWNSIFKDTSNCLV